MKVVGNRRIKLNELDKSFEYNILPIGKFYDPRYEWLDFSEERLKKIAENFGKGIPSYKPPVNVEHDSFQGKFGEITEVWIEDGLMIKVVCSEEGWPLVKDKKFEYMSAEINDYFDKEKGVSVGECITGAALTNKPANPYVNKIELSEDEIKKIKADKKEEEITMTPEQIAAMQAENEKLKKEKEEADKKAAKLAEDNKKIEQEKKKAEADAKAKGWVEKGVPAVLADKLKGLMLSEAKDGTIKLSDGTEKTIASQVEEIAELVTKVDFKQFGKKTERQGITLSDEDKSFEESLERVSKKK